MRIEYFRDNGRLRARLFRDGRLISVKPAERVIDGAQPEQRHQYNILKVFELHFPNMSFEDKLRLINGEEVEI